MRSTCGTTIIGGLLFAVIGVIVLARPMESPPNPFLDYADFFPGQYWSGGVARAFRCNADVAGGNEYCFFSPANESFLEIGVTILGDQITRTTFTLRQNTLKAGDLTALWGRPDIQLLNHSAYLDWPARGITAVAQTDDRRFDYWLPVVYVAFSQ